MSQTSINTPRFAERLQKAGFAAPQAAALARTLDDELTERLPSKADFKVLEAKLDALERKLPASRAKSGAKFDGTQVTLLCIVGALTVLLVVVKVIEFWVGV